MQRAGLSARRCPRDPVASRFVGRARAAAHAETQPLLLPPPATIPERGYGIDIEWSKFAALSFS